jgi:hypothetical protein
VGTESHPTFLRTIFDLIACKRRQPAQATPAQNPMRERQDFAPEQQVKPDF